MKHRILLINGLLMFTVGLSFSQAGLQFYGGLSNAVNDNELVTPIGQSHSGWHFGADARLNEGKMYFVVGLQYHKIDFLADRDTLSGSNLSETYNWTKFRVGLGYTVVQFNEKIALRGHSLLSFNLISGVPTENTIATYTNYNSGVAGVNLGLGFDIYNFTIDLSYEIGFFNVVNRVDDTSFDFTTISIGYKI